MRIFCRPGGRPANRNAPVESVTANARAAGTATMTPDNGLPLNADFAPPARTLVVSLCAARDAGSNTASTQGTARRMAPPSVDLGPDDHRPAPRAVDREL